MAAQLIDGKKVAAEVLGGLAGEVAQLKQSGSTPGLAVIIIGDDPASHVYVNAKDKVARELGLHSLKYQLEASATQAQVLALVRRLNEDPAVHGILVQSPPPPHINEEAIIHAIAPHKDVDCFHPFNVGKMLIGDRDGIFPCTPYGVTVLLEHYGLDTAGKHVVVLGRSNIVGKPMAALLLQKGRGADATVTVCHSRTRDLKEHLLRADIIVAAIGKANFVTADMVRPGAIVVDVGINRVPDPAKAQGFRLCGDVVFDEVREKAAWITPVPGGVGPMTIAMLMRNTVVACRAAATTGGR